MVVVEGGGAEPIGYALDGLRIQPLLCDAEDTTEPEQRVDLVAAVDADLLLPVPRISWSAWRPSWRRRRHVRSVDVSQRPITAPDDLDEQRSTEAHQLGQELPHRDMKSVARGLTCFDNYRARIRSRHARPWQVRTTARLRGPTRPHPWQRDPSSRGGPVKTPLFSLTYQLVRQYGRLKRAGRRVRGRRSGCTNRLFGR